MFTRTPKRQFTLRSLFVIMAVASLCSVYASNRIARHRRAIVALRAARAIVLFNYQETSGDFDPSLHPSAPSWLRRWISDDYLGSIVFVRIRPDSINADLLQAIAAVGTVKHLTLSGAALSQPMVEAIAPMESLTTLSLDGANIDDSMVGPIAKLPRLEYLDLSDTHITNASLAALRRSLRLRELDVSGTYVTVDCVRSLRAWNQRLDVNFAYAKEVGHSDY